MDVFYSALGRTVRYVAIMHGINHNTLTNAALCSPRSHVPYITAGGAYSIRLVGLSYGSTGLCHCFAATLHCLRF